MNECIQEQRSRQKKIKKNNLSIDIKLQSFSLEVKDTPIKNSPYKKSNFSDIKPSVKRYQYTKDMSIPISTVNYEMIYDDSKQVPFRKNISSIHSNYVAQSNKNQVSANLKKISNLENIKEV